MKKTKWQVYFCDRINNKRKNFVVYANSKQECMQIATTKCNNHNLNNFDIQLVNF